jgi:probable phosphoglycerate mutase
MSSSDPRFGRRRVYLMRHGHVDYFSDKVLRAGDHTIATLTPKGQDQAAAAGAALSETHLDLAISSGYPRTMETLDIVLAEREAPSPPVEVDAAFVELKGGTLKFASRADAAAAMQAEFAAAGEPGARMFNGEAFADAQARSVAALEALLLGRIWKHALIVAHEGVNRLILSWAVGAGLSAASAFEQDTACINVLDFDLRADDDGQPVIARRIVKAVNITPYNWLKHGMSRTSLEAIFAAD